jgi:hypothetical protein
MLIGKLDIRVDLANNRAVLANRRVREWLRFR